MCECVRECVCVRVSHKYLFIRQKLYGQLDCGVIVLTRVCAGVSYKTNGEMSHYQNDVSNILRKIWINRNRITLGDALMEGHVCLNSQQYYIGLYM